MTHHGRRSQRAREKRLARRVVQDSAWFDDELAERINVLTSDQISILTEKRGDWLGRGVHVGREYDKGEVLTDVRGRGSLQEVPVPKSLERQLKRMQRLNEERRLARFERSQSLEEPNGHEDEDEPVLVEVYQPKRGICGSCGRQISRASKSGFCCHCYQGEMKKLREAGTT